MPVWDFQYPPGLLAESDKHDLAKAITKIYTAVGLPAFYVQTRFTEKSPGTQFIGEEAATKYVSIQIVHAARKLAENRREAFLSAADAVLNPVLGPKGLDWEYWVHEVDRELWKINGLVPPPTGSDMEKEWARANAPVQEAKL